MPQKRTKETLPNEKKMLDNGWISVNKKVPEYDVPVLVCQAGEEKSIDICRLESKTECKDRIIYKWLKENPSDDYWYYDVTHWQPLPSYT